MDRVKPGAIEQIFDDLTWLGLDWDIGPQNAEQADSDQVYVQSNRRDFYTKALQDLKRDRRIYPCSCSRKDLQNFQSAPHPGEELSYPNHCRDRDADEVIHEAKLKGKPVSWRFKTDEKETYFEDFLMGESRSNLSQWSGDFVVARGDDEVGYQLAVVLDDLDHGVTEVVRGDDLLMSTHRQIQLHKALKKDHPSYFHLPLIEGSDGIRLAKRHGDWKISTLRKLGHSPQTILGLLAWTLGWVNDGESLDLMGFTELFEFKTVPRNAFAMTEKCATQMGVLP
jgi:glutamyl-tRNA synthetase